MIVGLCWTGSVGHRNNANRSIPAALLGPLFEIPGVEWRAFCRDGWTPEMAPFVANALTVEDGDWFDTARAMQALDLMITVDTAIAHVAGGLGIPTWLLVHAVPDFRWGLIGDTTPWYRAIRIFRQRQHGDWPDVLRRVAQALEAEQQTRRLAT